MKSGREHGCPKPVTDRRSVGNEPDKHERNSWIMAVLTKRNPTKIFQAIQGIETLSATAQPHGLVINTAPVGRIMFSFSFSI